MTTKPSLTLVRRIKAPPAKVFAAWTEPEMMAGWFGPSHTEVASAEADPRAGGRFRVVMQATDGEVHDVSGVYREVVPDRKLVFTWAWISTPERESLVTVSLRPVEDGTELTLTHERFFDEAAREGHRGGWTEALDKLEQLFADKRDKWRPS
ncbi:MAG: SRPBCC domain-containing protein [Pseudomonadota bacterium]|nr:SRPBCC domain-containing protein [Pseudomonadota bacterium]